ncbi:MAG: Putative Nudix hydrolase YfcD [uncultured Rubrobacteraceae bacterium]|uniref:Nudix hydrolase YfcD n=1 Tax=uncultured Rubrobacteraceae bacterium TaxID=349277 RepID=A0A6J4PHK1_9ACTN|nr:MAG: Putative Nudix hydrolase YfcD [uncultured Rubrobacteraceae bacterium]
MDELIDVRDESGGRTGEVAWKSEAHRSGLWHRCFHCWIFGVDAGTGEPYLLVQRRTARKDTWPGYLDVTAAGHLAAGEESLDGLREVEEELGLRVDPGRLVPLGTRRVEQRIPGGLDREFHDVFLLPDNTDPADLRLQKEEVESVLGIGLDDAEALGDAGSAPAREYRDGEVLETLIRPPDFVPNTDDYLRRVAVAARAALDGGRVERIF